MFLDIVKKSRSYRRFYESETVSQETLVKLINYARLSPSGANRQALRFYISCDQDTNNKLFHSLIWAAYLTDWNGPEEGERPAGYIVMVQHEDYKMAAGVDHGIAAQSILLGAAEMGLGGCMFAGIRKDKAQEALNIPEGYEILLVIALGKPKETVVIDEIDQGEDIKYWRDQNGIHHVPKRKLKDIVLNVKTYKD